jgi:dTDP-4-amino-4,6-dideoxygalactose transaminase
MRNDEHIYVTQPFLPSLKEYTALLEKIWANKQVTNNGPFHQKLEQELCDYLGVKYISLFCNGTIALLIAMKALRISDEVITTPFSFVATAHSIKWNGSRPVFSDISAKSCNLDPNLIERMITDKTTCILPVHVYGNPCNFAKIHEVAKKYDLKVIYDAAHAFGVEEKGKSILNKGDLSVLSFHGTKVFNTFEGGAIVSKSKNMKRRIDNLKNFSISDELSVTGLGINGKMNELQAAMGLIQLKHYKQIMNKRMMLDKLYRDELKNINGIHVLEIAKDIQHNYSYFPIFINEKKYGKSRDRMYNEFVQNNIHVRRYFFPLISQFSEYKSLPSAKKSNLPNADRMSREVLCLPIYPDLSLNDIERVINILRVNA